MPRIEDIDMLASALHKAYYPNNTMTWRDAFLLAVASVPGSLILFIAAYLTKSALGINLAPGPSPLHDLFYWMLLTGA